MYFIMLSLNIHNPVNTFPKRVRLAEPFLRQFIQLCLPRLLQYHLGQYIVIQVLLQWYIIG